MTGTRPTGDFCWINVMTRDAVKARAFFARLFGWTYGDLGVPGGQLFSVGGRAAGAFMDMQAANFPADMPPGIGVMVRVDDVDESLAEVKALGGQAQPPMDVLENGRMAMCTDPNGAVFGLWQPKSKIGFEHDSHAHGGPGWFESPTTDVERAAKFYGALFGWQIEPRPMPGFVYTLCKIAERPIAGLMPIVKQMGDVKPAWNTFFSVDDAAATERLGRELGAKVCVPTMEIPNVGRFAALESPQGVPCNVLEWAR